MAIRDTWHRALVYFGLAEDPDYVERDHYEPETGAQPDALRVAAAPHRPPSAASASAAACATRSTTSSPTTSPADARARCARLAATAADVRVHLVPPHSFNDAQEVADRFKQGVPVILNLQTTEGELAKRLIDFASGLTYALDGGMQKVAEKTFLLTPRNVEVSAEEQARLVEKGFFNQS